MIPLFVQIFQEKKGGFPYNFICVENIYNRCLQIVSATSSEIFC